MWVQSLGQEHPLEKEMIILGKENSNSLQYSCLGNPMDRGALRAIVHEVTNSWTQLSDLTKYHPAISLVQSPYGSLL